MEGVGRRIYDRWRSGEEDIWLVEGEVSDTCPC